VGAAGTFDALVTRASDPVVAVQVNLELTANSAEADPGGALDPVLTIRRIALERRVDATEC